MDLITTKKEQEAFEKAKKIAAVLSEKKAKNIKILYIKNQTVIADFFVICHGTSTTQIKALADEVEFRLRQENEITASGKEGYISASWTVLDYDDVIVHIFDKSSRDYFKLEKLWADAEEVFFETEENEKR